MHNSRVVSPKYSLAIISGPNVYTHLIPVSLLGRPSQQSDVMKILLLGLIITMSFIFFTPSCCGFLLMPFIVKQHQHNHIHATFMHILEKEPFIIMVHPQCLSLPSTRGSHWISALHSRTASPSGRGPCLAFTLL